MWVVKVCTHGGSLSASLPRQMCRDLNINRGTLLLVNHSRQGEIVMRELTTKEFDDMKARSKARAAKTI